MYVLWEIKCMFCGKTSAIPNLPYSRKDNEIANLISQVVQGLGLYMISKHTQRKKEGSVY